MTRPSQNSPERPPEPLPPPLRGADENLFAHVTVTARLPEIARRLAAGDGLEAQARDRLEALAGELPNGPVRPLEDPQAPDAGEWRRYPAPYLGQDYFTVPWFFAEAYFFRRVLGATGYYQAGPGYRRDPYAPDKRQGLDGSAAAAAGLAAALETSLSRPADGLEALLEAALWGNQADLSVWPAGVPGGANPAGGPGAPAGLLADDRAGVIARLLARPERVDFLLDNAGLELVSDLALADLLLSGGLAREVRLHVKPHPTYVSDVTHEDVALTLAHLRSAPDAPVRALARRLQAGLEQGRLRLRTHFFWTSPLPLWELPAGLRRELGGAGLLLVKGDAHYRRCLGDLAWPFTTPFEQVLRYAPAPLAALRVIKSEVLAGLAPGQEAAVARRDPRWLTSGHWGVIQLSAKEQG